MSPRIVDIEARRAAVLDAASKVFSERGYTAATIEEIAQVAGIGKGTTYEYFTSKQELLLAALDHEWRRLVAATDLALGTSDGTVLERLDDLTAAVMRSYDEVQRLRPAAMEFMVSSGAPDACGRLMRTFRDGMAVFRDRATGIIQTGIERGELSPELRPADLATTLLGSLDGLLMQARHDPALEPAVLWRSFLRVVVRGMAVPPDGRTERTSVLEAVRRTVP